MLAACAQGSSSTTVLESAPAGSGEHAATPRVAQADDLDASDAGELRVALEQLLGHHATTAVRLTRAAVRGDPDFTETATAALSANTDDLTEVVESIYGPEGAEEFRRLWLDHVQALFGYTEGLVSDDDAAVQDAVEQLDQYRADFGAFVETATDGELDAETVSEVLEVHVDDLAEQVRAFADEDYGRAYELQRSSYAHMFPTGKALAGGFAGQLPGEFPVTFDDAPQQLRSALGLLLGEHVELGIDAMRAGVTGAPEFDAAAGALEANTSELTEAMEALFGPDGAESFSVLWADHIDFLVAYTVAVAEDDDAGRDAAREGLEGYEEGFGQLLEEATAEELDAETVTANLHQHDAQLIDQIEAYAEEDYASAHRLAYDAYRHIFDVAAALAQAVEAQVGEELPVGGAPTGGGGTASSKR